MSARPYFDNLAAALKLHHHKDVISIVGAGGKTSTLFRLGKELSSSGKRIILTTTTHIEMPNMDIIKYSGELDIDLMSRIESSISENPVVLARRMVRGDKLKGLSLKQIAEINRDIVFDYMIIEADGAQHKSLKAPHKYEPPVPSCTTLFIVVIGFDIIGKPLNMDNVHRPQIVSRIVKKKTESIIEPDDIIKLLQHPEGLLKGRPPATRTAVILNKVKEQDMRTAVSTAKEILNSAKGINSVVCGQVNSPRQLTLFT